MSNAYLELSINGLTVRLERFLNGALPRIDAEVGNTSVNYTAPGSVVISGGVSSFALWNVETVADQEQHKILKLIYLESEYQRRNNGNPNILITDTTQLFEERGVRTRAIAPGTSEIVQGAYRLYYARYYGVLQRQPDWEILGNGFRAAFTVLETDRTSP